MISSKEQAARLNAYITRCSHLIFIANLERTWTPDQREMVARWKRIKRALSHDLERLLAAHPDVRQLSFMVSDKEFDDVYWWYWRQRQAFKIEGINDPLKESVDEQTTPQQSGF